MRLRMKVFFLAQRSVACTPLRETDIRSFHSIQPTIVLSRLVLFVKKCVACVLRHFVQVVTDAILKQHGAGIKAQAK